MNSDVHAVCNSYRDVHPKKFLGRAVQLRAARPIVHLRHGFEGVKTTRAKGRSFRNCLVRYSVAARSEPVVNELRERGKFHRSQILPLPAVPRWRTLLEAERDRQAPPEAITWFLTWRDGTDGRPEDLATYEYDLIGDVRSVLRLLEEPTSPSLQLRIVLHQYWPQSSKSAFEELKREFPHHAIEVLAADEEDVEAILVDSCAVITDYSSVAFDAGFIGRPVRFHCPDIDVYARRRDLYGHFLSEMRNRTHSAKELAAWILAPERGQDPYIAAANFGPELRTELEERRVHKAIVGEVEALLQNRIVFVGYNFFGIGGTVYSTRNLAGALAERGYLVELLSLKDSSARVSRNPPGVPVRALHPKPRSRASRLARVLDVARPGRLLPSERNAKALTSLAILRLVGLILCRRFGLIVSTRESLHRLIHDFAETRGQRCAYWFHNSDLSLLENYPGIIGELSPANLGTVIAPSDGHFRQLRERFSYNSYSRSETIPNLLAPGDILPRDDIWPVSYANFSLLALSRLSPDRRVDLERLLEFAEFLAHLRSPYRIEVFGGGQLLAEMQSRSSSQSVLDHITFHGPTRKPIRKIRAARCVIDFSENHTFGMIYLESVLNGTPVFARENPGSRILLGGSDYFFSTFEELKAKIDHAPFLGLDRLLKLYDSALGTYGPDAVCDQFIGKLLRD